MQAISYQNPSPAILIILVNYKRPIDTVSCVHSLLEMKYHNWECIIYENGSGDNSYEKIKDEIGKISLAKNSSRYKTQDKNKQTTYEILGDYFSRFITIENGPSNLGFAGGNNKAYEIISSQTDIDSFDYIWFLNNDTYVNSDALDELISKFNEPDSIDIGICGSTILYFDSKNIIQCLGGASYEKWTGRVTELGNGSSLGESKISEVESKLSYVSGASMFVSKKFINTVGLMNDSYFLYYEELDWAIRGQMNGFRFGFAPNSIVRHKEGSVLGSGKNQKRSAISEYYGLSSRLKFTKIHFPLALPSIWFFGLLQLLKRISSGKWSNAKALFRALLFMKIA